jgi:hypothetical protein
MGLSGAGGSACVDSARLHALARWHLVAVVKIAVRSADHAVRLDVPSPTADLAGRASNLPGGPARHPKLEGYKRPRSQEHGQ